MLPLQCLRIVCKANGLSCLVPLLKASLLQPLEEEIRLSFIPSLLRRNVNDEERVLLSLPARLGAWAF